MRVGLSAVVIVFSLLCLGLYCAGEEESTSSSKVKYTFVPKPFPCDYEMNIRYSLEGFGSFESSEGSREPIAFEENIKMHGVFSLFTSDGNTSVCRNDLDDQRNLLCLGDTGEGNTCKSTEDKSPGIPEPIEFEHKEPAVFNGHNCFKYYDNETEVIWADEDGTMLGGYLFIIFSIEFNFTYPSTPYTADMFTLPSDTTCDSYPKVFTAPEKDVFTDACNIPISSSSTPTSSASSVSPVNPGSSASSLNPTSSVRPSGSSSSDMNTAGNTRVSVVLLLLVAVVSLLIF